MHRIGVTHRRPDDGPSPRPSCAALKPRSVSPPRSFNRSATNQLDSGGRARPGGGRAGGGHGMCGGRPLFGCQSRGKGEGRKAPSMHPRPCLPMDMMAARCRPRERGRGRGRAHEASRVQARVHRWLGRAGRMLGWRGCGGDAASIRAGVGLGRVARGGGNGWTRWVTGGGARLVDGTAPSPEERQVRGDGEAAARCGCTT